MKKLFLYFALVMTCINAQAQKQYYKSTKDGKAVTKTSRWKDYARSQYWGLRMGVNFASVGFHHGAMNNIHTSSRTGFNIAFLYGKQIASPDVPLFIETGLRYSQKGLTSDFNFIEKKEIAHYHYRHNLNYLEIPLNVKYKFKTGVDDLTIQPFLGGFFDLGLGSKTLRYEPVQHREIFDSFSDDFFKRIDAGLRFGCGLAYQNFYFEITYDWGMANLCHDDMKGAKSPYKYPMFTNFDESAHSSCVSMSIGVDF